ncbi:hypothetical protein E8E13_010061 [Curvularia kusanoi]|uniref:BTB domain-containing protein n=1 Tax=Curvularia kusanoi TaxID=90978 RepID=A0A9P4WD04_CURKU|nr:hypothetical protein E8E13_010061 [Curvularia kusanoi]
MAVFSITFSNPLRKSSSSAQAAKTYVTGSHFSADSSPATSTLDLTRSRASSNASSTSTSAYSAQSTRSLKHSRSTSASTTDSSTPSVGSAKRSRHLRALSDGFHVGRRLQKKPSSQHISQRQSDPIPTPTAMLTPVTILGPERIVDIQQADLLVRCQDDDYHVDRSIMCHHSTWFAKVYSKVNYPRMSKRIVDLSADEPGAVAAMVQYCYQLDYGDTRSGANTALYSVISLRPHLDTYLLAERYGMPGLQKLSAQKYEKLALAVLEATGDEGEFVQSIRDLYAPSRRTRAEELRRTAVRICADHLGSAVLGIGKEVSVIVALMDEVPEFRADLFEQLAKRWNSLGLCQQDLGQENALLPDQIHTPASESVPDTQIRHPQAGHVQRADLAYYGNAPLRYEQQLSEFGPERSHSPEKAPRPLPRNQCFESLEKFENDFSPAVVRGQSIFGPLPVVQVDTQLLFGTNPSDLITTVNSPSPSALGFGELSLNSRSSPIPPSVPQCEDEYNRTTVRIMSASFFARRFPQISPNEVIILFDKGREIRKFDKYPLCAASRFFARLLDGPFLDQKFTRCIRLRDDLPHAINIMIYFIETEQYVFDQTAFETYPLLTALDFHLHAYLVSNKYGVTAMRDHAMHHYLETAEEEMTVGLMMLKHSQLSEVHGNVGFPTAAPADEHSRSHTVITPLDRFLNSLTLLWKNTQSRDDAMRQAVLGLIKRDLNKLLRVPFFVTLLQEVVGFGDDLVAGLEDDGLGVTAYQVAAGREIQSIFFEI